MAEVDTKSEVIESKVNEPKNEDGDESKENEDGDESKENEDGGKSLENTPKPKRTPLKSMPLHDSPLTQSGRRVRTPVQQLVMEKKEEFVYEFNGVGVALGEILYIEHMISKEVPDVLKKLHSVCFNRTGDRNNVKKNLRQFNGFSYDKTDKKYEAKKTNMDRFNMADLKTMCKILGLEVTGMKTDVIDRILDFVLKPQDNNKSLPGKKKKKSGNKKKRSDKGKKRERKSKGGDTESDSAANDENDSTANDENDSTANDTADSSDSGSESESEEKPKKTPAKKPAKTPAKKVATKTPAKKTPAKKTPAKKTPAKKTPAKKAPAKRSKSDVDSDSDSSDDEPLIKKTKSPPTNDEIKKKVEEILEGADLEEVTMKSVCKQIYEIYPGFDLTDRKSFIKETVKAIIS